MLADSCSENPVAFDMDNLVREKQIRTHAVACGLSLDNDQLERLYNQICKLFELKNKVYYREIDAFLEELNSWPVRSWQLKGVKVKIGFDTSPQAKLNLVDPLGDEVHVRSKGSTTVEAICNAIAEVTNVHVFLMDFNFANLVPGINTLGVANIMLRYHNHEVRARAYSVDFIEAVTKAILLGINTILEKFG